MKKPNREELAEIMGQLDRTHSAVRSDSNLVHNVRVLFVVCEVILLQAGYCEQIV